MLMKEYRICMPLTVDEVSVFVFPTLTQTLSGSLQGERETVVVVGGARVSCALHVFPLEKSRQLMS